MMKNYNVDILSRCLLNKTVYVMLLLRIVRGNDDYINPLSLPRLAYFIP